MKSLTKREKVLLYIMTAVAIVAGMVVLVIQPATEKADALDASITERENAITTITAELSAAAGVSDSIGSLEAEILKEQSYYLPVMTNNELDEYVTGLLQSHGLMPLSLSISAPEDAAQSIVKTYYVDTTARGSMSQFMLLIDTVRELTGIRISTIQAAEVPATPTPSPAARKAKTNTKTNANSAQTPEPIFAASSAVSEKDFTIQTVFVVQEYDANAAVDVPAPEESTDLSTPSPAAEE